MSSYVIASYAAVAVMAGGVALPQLQRGYSSSEYAAGGRSNSGSSGSSGASGSSTNGSNTASIPTSIRSDSTPTLVPTSHSHMDMDFASHEFGMRALCRIALVTAAAASLRAVAVAAGYEMFTNVRSAYIAPDDAPMRIGFERSAELLRLRAGQLPDVMLVKESSVVLLQFVTGAGHRSTGGGDKPSAAYDTDRGIPSTSTDHGSPSASTSDDGSSKATTSTLHIQFSCGSSARVRVDPTYTTQGHSNVPAVMVDSIRRITSGTTNWLGRPVLPAGPEFFPSPAADDVIPFLLHSPQHDERLLAAFRDTLQSVGENAAAHEILLAVNVNGEIDASSLAEFRTLMEDLGSVVSVDAATAVECARIGVRRVQNATRAIFVSVGA